MANSHGYNGNTVSYMHKLLSSFFLTVEKHSSALVQAYIFTRRIKKYIFVDTSQDACSYYAIFNLD